jgi:hypothetical protein
MAIETTLHPVGADQQVTVKAPQNYALAIRRVDKDNVRCYLLAEKDLLALVGEAHIEVPDDVLDFALEEGIVEYLERAVKATREVFADADRITASLKEDEYGERYVDVNAAVRDGPETEAEKYSACVEKWATLMPPHAGGKIHLSTSWA